MGSLMAGWDCPVQDQETARMERNRSLTKEEIESFWRVRRRSIDGEEGRSCGLQGVLSVAARPRPRPALVPVGKDTKLTGDWWTRSNWAFLNEPPLEAAADSAHKYTAQFHIAQIATPTPPAKETTLPHDAASPAAVISKRKRRKPSSRSCIIINYTHPPTRNVGLVYICAEDYITPIELAHIDFPEPHRELSFL
ncbi:unnamed protein product [Spirodela intermedia]|uniref:Uncharacterized protein n=1 Tax=Spirodela intermedia TaxID=51605 RepID=A0A7I8JFB0_SPIIN|nr:unnamed protein product [Spirodela intermedia]CAA6668834.1 unnamed protein product [Spirodela intermedia]